RDHCGPHHRRPAGDTGFVCVPHGVVIDGEQLLHSHVGLRGGPAPVRRFLPGAQARDAPSPAVRATRSRAALDR
ncbi:hypothetical protein ACFFTL_18935, partial [Streptomyces yanii]